MSLTSSKISKLEPARRKISRRRLKTVFLTLNTIHPVKRNLRMKSKRRLHLRKSSGRLRNSAATCSTYSLSSMVSSSWTRMRMLCSQIRKNPSLSTICPAATTRKTRTTRRQSPSSPRATRVSRSMRSPRLTWETIGIWILAKSQCSISTHYRDRSPKLASPHCSVPIAWRKGLRKKGRKSGKPVLVGREKISCRANGKTVTELSIDETQAL